MTGTYSGGYHGTGDFEFAGSTGADIKRNHDLLKAKGAANIAAASDGGTKEVRSADGRRVLFDPVEEAAKRARRRARELARRGGQGPGSAGVVTGKGTSGPGAPVVGGGHTTGPGRGGVGQPDGGLSPVVFGGPGLGVITTGPAFGFGEVGKPYVGTYPPVVTEGKGGDLRTSIQVAGVQIQPAPGVSDMNMAENRYGDDGPASWLLGTFVLGADLVNTANVVLQANNPYAGESVEEKKQRTIGTGMAGVFW